MPTATQCPPAKTPSMATNSDLDGLDGFSYTKLSAADGSPLAIQNVSWAAAGDEASGSHWGCVRDNVTGLIWEAKLSDAAGPRYFDNSYTWYNSSLPAAMQGELYGAVHGAICPAPADEGPAKCNTEFYVAYVNSIQLCGFSDWRMPTPEELVSLINNGIEPGSGPVVDTRFLGPTSEFGYWSASPFVNDNSIAWYVGFGNGYVSTFNKESGGHVRLVRGGQ